MKTILRIVGVLLVTAGVMFMIMAIGGARDNKPAIDGAKSASGQLVNNFYVREKLISGAYKVYGAKDQPLSLWLAKTVFKNETPGLIADLKVRYKLGEYADWCSWQTYPSLVPTETVVDLYYPLLSDKCAKLSSRTPAELQMECEYLDAAGRKHTIQNSRRLTILGKQEIYFNDLSSQEKTGSIQDFMAYSDLLAAWVTKADPPVAGLASMANKAAGGVGAGGNVTDCVKVMEQLYEIMRSIHITYQHPATQIEKNQSFDMMLVQSVQYPRDTIQKRSGTCIDLAILYAAMMESVGIPAQLVSLRGHVFPIAELPNGVLLPVEATCVGGGGAESEDFATAVKAAQKKWQELKESGEFVLTDCRKCWGAGISTPELEPLPADILERWSISEKNIQGNEVQQIAPGNGGVGKPSTMLAPGAWQFTIEQMGTGSKIQGTVQVAVQGNSVQMVFALAYPITGQDGMQHRAQEQNTFTGQLQGQQVIAQCTQAIWSIDGMQVAPQGLPFTLKLNITGNGRSASGTVQNSQGSGTQLAMQLM